MADAPVLGGTDKVKLDDDVFGAPFNGPLVHEVVVAELAARRRGTHATRNRALARGGGRKPYRQKGTGRARQGSIRAPQFSGGGIVHGPTPRSYAQKTPKKMKADALAALSKVLEALGAPARGVLLVLDREDEVTWLSLRNVSSVHLLLADQLN